MSAVIGQVTAKAREQQNRTNANQQPQRARFKLVFIYKNGSYSPPYFSYDRHGKTIQEDLGLVKLIRLVEKRRGEFVVASIFMSTEDQPRCRTATGELNRIYNLLVYKEVLGKRGEWTYAVKFTEGRAEL